MTPEQQELFIKVAQVGVACGLSTYSEWYENWVLHGLNIAVGIAEQECVALDEAFAAFLRGCASCPEEEEDFSKMSDGKILAYFIRPASFSTEQEEG